MKNEIRMRYLANTNVIMISISFILLIVATAALIDLRGIQKNVILNCSDFSSEDIGQLMAYYKDGHSGLDKNGDGIPCNELFK